MKKILLLLLLVVAINVGYAQRTQVKEPYSMPVLPDVTDFPYKMRGIKTCDYVVDKDGDRVYDGSVSIKCEMPFTTFNVGFYSCSASAHFNATANFTKGVLHGEYKSDRKAAVSIGGGANLVGAKMGVEGIFTGAFKNGKPNGTFNMDMKAHQNGSTAAHKIKVNYKDGILVGDYYLYEEGKREFSGTLTQDGKLTGIWNKNGYEAVYDNGFLISDKDIPAESAAAELSRKYVAGTISEEELLENGYRITTVNFHLGELVSDAVLEYFGSDFIDKRDFEQKSVTFQYLKAFPMLTDEGVNAIIYTLCKYYKTGPINYKIEDSNKYVYIKSIKLDKKGNHYITMRANSLVVGATQGELCDVFIKKGQYKQIEDAVNAYIKANCLMTLVEAIQDKHDDSVLKAYLLGNRAEWNAEAERIKPEQVEMSNLQALAEYREMTRTRLTEIYHLLSQELEDYKQAKQPAKDELLVSIDGYNVWGYRFVAQASEAEVEKILMDIRSERVAIERDYNMKITQVRVEYMRTSKKLSNICYGQHADEVFYSTSGLSYWGSELEKRLKKFGKISDFEFVSADREEAVLNIKVFGKKKTIITYQLTIPHKEGKLHAESFDIEKAKIVE